MSETRVVTDVYLALGSNVGDRRSYLKRAVEHLRHYLTIIRTSSVYETEPVGVTNQPMFLNLVLQGETRLAPRELLRAIKRVEADVGRLPTFRWGPRVIDIDILLFGAEEVDYEELRIPHPEMLNRRFVALPLLEIAPDVRWPDGKKVAEHLADPYFQDQGVRRLGDL